MLSVVNAHGSTESGSLTDEIVRVGTRFESGILAEHEAAA